MDSSRHYILMRWPLILIFFAVILFAAVPDDKVIAAKIRQKMDRSRLKSEGLTFQVKEGVVEWAGTVVVPQRKGAATRMAKSAGARRVVNRIVAKGPAHSPQSKPMPRTATVKIPKP